MCSGGPVGRMVCVLALLYGRANVTGRHRATNTIHEPALSPFTWN